MGVVGKRCGKGVEKCVGPPHFSTPYTFFTLFHILHTHPIHSFTPFPTPLPTSPHNFSHPHTFLHTFPSPLTPLPRLPLLHPLLPYFLHFCSYSPSYQKFLNSPIIHTLPSSLYSSIPPILSQTPPPPYSPILTLSFTPYQNFSLFSFIANLV